ncbi:hypothetical protein PG997_010795 [Apiospora hydei]|uniref:Uncharacterized protein n=1 Tax=Apiospora hydei TaxID=1337664 RepID=A0ABR1VH95_9PEZI
MPADRASLNSLIDLDESLFGITDDSTNKHISPEYPSTPPRSANGTAAPWSSAGMFFGEDGLSMSPLRWSCYTTGITPQQHDGLYSPPIPETSPHRPTSSFPHRTKRTKTWTFREGAEAEAGAGAGGGGGHDDDEHDDDDHGPFWLQSVVDPPRRR